MHPDVRDDLRARAVQAWQEAKDLSERAHQAVSASRLRGESMLLRLAPESARASAVAKVDRIVTDRLAEVDLVAAGFGVGVGLVAAHQTHRLGALHDALHRRFDRVTAAGDGATAVGLAIMEQPDVAVIDGDLAVMGGLETALVVRTYAPGTGILLITSEPDVDRWARTQGIVAQGPSADEAQLLTAIDELLDDLSRGTSGALVGREGFEPP